jgi:RNA polymerase sigma factor (sigma-70 family)
MSSAIPDAALIEVAAKFAKNVPLQDQDDCQQDLTVALLKARTRFDPTKGTWDQYAKSTALRAIQDFWRHHPTWDRYSQAPTPVAPYEDKHAPTYDPLPSASLALTDLLCDLRPRDKRVLLYLIAGYTANEICSMLRISPGYIPKLLRHLRVKNSEPFSTQLRATQHVRRAA